MRLPTFSKGTRTSEGVEWTKAFVKGEASFEEGFGSALEMMQQWKEVGMLDASDAEAGINDVFTQLMERKAAMVYPVGGLATLKKVMAEGVIRLVHSRFLERIGTTRC